MTDRHSGYVVTLAKNIREDDAVATISAIQQIKGVLSVQPVLAGIGIEEMQAQSRARHAFMEAARGG